MTPTLNWPTLNWKEIAVLTELLRPKLEGLFVDKVFIPERSRFPSQYLKGEWALRLAGSGRDLTFFFSVRPRHPYFASTSSGLRQASQATHAVFDLGLMKHLRGSRLISIEAAPRERCILIWFTGTESRKLGLVLWLIPSAPEALLVHEDLEIIARSRTVDTPDSRYRIPDGSKAPPDLEIRTEWLKSTDAWLAEIERGLELEAFELRRARAERLIAERLKETRVRIRQSEAAVSEASRESDWQKSGDLLKAALGLPETIETRGKVLIRKVHDYETEQEVELPCDPKLGASEQVSKFYQLARRKQRRSEEAQSRIGLFRVQMEKLERASASLPAHLNWESLAEVELPLGLTDSAATSRQPREKKTRSWLGKEFLSSEGMRIWIGRNKDENLELTFKHARGNDVWMHVRGKPGAHVVIPLNSGKSAALESLLDAAQLCLHYSGGQAWGKTEVDYTFKKHVKRIRDSSEASYTHNRTLIVEPDSARLKRLLAQNP